MKRKLTCTTRKPTRNLLTIAESLDILREGHRITCADGYRWFPYNAGRGGIWHLSRAAFNHLREHGYIEFAKVQHPHCATWEATDKIRMEDAEIAARQWRLMEGAER